jgi:hypothetical protein
MNALTAELGDRAAAALRAENAGLVAQRLDAIRSRRQPRRLAWSWWIEYGANGMAARMRPATRIEP